PAPAAPTPAPAPAPQVAASGLSPDLSLWGYGEIYYTHPTHDPALTRFDLARAVFGIGYQLDERTSFNSEFEVEHAVASASDQGEFEVEQFYVDHQFDHGLSAKGGLFLMPFGLLNEHHEPNAYYGVQRNFVETLVVPSTWREGGAELQGTASGWTWDLGLTTGFNLAGWNANPEDPQYRSALELEDNGVAPLQATHQELQLADASHLAQFAALNYTGIPGLRVGGALFTGEAAMPQVPAGLPRARTTLWELHTRWTPGAADLQAVFARGTISHTAAYNEANAGAANPLPSSFLGYYAQAAYTVWQDGAASLSPFVRWEHFDMGASYAGIAPGFSTVPAGLAADGKPWPQPRDRVTTLGANYNVNDHLVLKADYQHFDVNTDFSRVDLGLGVSF
ncbi:MAG TPA: porin, partial [Burkholderiaceae bacterium]